MHETLAHLSLIAIVALSILLMLLRPRRISEVYWVGSGALLLVVLRLIPFRLAVHAVAEGSDVYLFLIGMMLLSELARENGVFDWLSAVAVHAARGSCMRLFALIYGVGICVTVCMSNDATAVVLTPAILAAVRRAKAEPIPFLFACAMIANAASFVLPISNPANLVVFHSGMPSLGRWLMAFLVPSLFSIAATFLLLRIYFRRELKASIEVLAEKVQLSHNGRYVLYGLAFVVVVLLVASSLRLDLGLPTCLAALAITAILCFKGKKSPLPIIREISWSTLALVAALFILVHAVESVGALSLAEMGLHRLQAMGAIRGSLSTALIVALANNLVNNLPLGLIAGSTLAASQTHGLFAHAVLVGVDLGPNLSVTGSLATILWLLALRREQIHVTAVDFLKVGILAMPAALLSAMLGLLMMFALAGN
ncbi:arsenic transporter [Silvibacterium dinghuense]|uniref:Arsenic transporter n=1 Tax=Silvibacterium dinghuense TaxID=1560006 RepID=A0A4Q1SDF9_9BACT|nr:arsenic transporter [Silvibacterium dinghuense]RXS95117.1 arsenic transporter [Silvibacterium dinghuense]GGH10777.1 arsenic transporter [Silvibacterium dinghuense]